MLQKSHLFEYATYSAWEKSYKSFFLVKTSLVKWCNMLLKGRCIRPKMQLKK